MIKKKLLKLSVILGVIGLAMIFSIILIKSVYPDMFFRLVLPVGLLFVFVSAILGFISWLWYLKDAVKTKQYSLAIILLIIGLFVFIKELVRIL